MFKATQVTFSSTIRSTNRRIKKLRIARYKIQRKATKIYLRDNKDKYGFNTFVKFSQETPENAFMKSIQKEPWERNVRLQKRGDQSSFAILREENQAKIEKTQETA